MPTCKSSSRTHKSHVKEDLNLCSAGSAPIPESEFIQPEHSGVGTPECGSEAAR